MIPKISRKHFTILILLSFVLINNIKHSQAAGTKNATVGDPLTLNYSSSGATSCSQIQVPGGYSTITPTANTSSSYNPGNASNSGTFTFTCTNAGVSGSDSATLTVTAAPAPTASLTISPAGSPYTYPATLTYIFSSNGAGSCYVYDQSGYVYITKASNQTTLNVTSSTGYGTITIYYQCWSGPNGAGTANTLTSQTITINCPNGTTWNGTNACTPNSVNDCSAQTKTWNTNCSGSVSATTNGSNSLSVSNTAPGYTGSATFSCSNTVFTVNPGATCSVAAGASCPLPWGGSIADGASVTAYQAATGNPCVSQTRTCTNGNLSGTYQFQSCTPSGGTNCPSQTVNWGAGCSGNVTATNHGTNSSSVNNVAGGYSGSSVFSCSNSTYTYSSGSCTAIAGGTLNVNPSSCVLAVEQSSCPMTYTWSSSDADAWIQYRFYDGTYSPYENANIYGNGSTGSKTGMLWMNSSGQSFTMQMLLRSTPGIGTVLASQALSLSCQPGLFWGGNFCTDGTPRVVIGTSTSCAIALNGSNCIGYITYSTANVANLVITDVNNVALTPTATGVNSGYVSIIPPMTVPYGTHTVRFKDGATLIKTSSITASCATGLGWDGTKCAASCPVNQYAFGGTCYSCPVGSTSTGGFVTSCTCSAGYSWDNTTRTCMVSSSITAVPNPCYIARSASTCSTDLSWTSGIANARVDVNGTIFSYLENATSVPATMNYGSNQIYVRDLNSGNAILQSTNVLGQCTGADVWNNTTCEASAGVGDLTAGTITPVTAIVGDLTPLQAQIENLTGVSTGIPFNNYIQVRTAAVTNIFFPWLSTPAGTPVDLAPVSMPSLGAYGTNTTLQNYTFPTVATYEARACADLSSSADVTGVIDEGGVGSPGEINNCSAWTPITVNAASGSGQFYSSPNPCYIARGASSCTSNIRWNTFYNPVNVTFSGITVANNVMSNGNTDVIVPYTGVSGPQMAILTEGDTGNFMEQFSISAICTGTDVWNGTNACVAASQNIDLTPSAIGVFSPSAGSPIAMTFGINSAGTKSTSGPFANHLKIAAGPNGTGNRSEIDYIWASALNGGSATNVSTTYTFPSAGTYSLQFCTDQPTSALVDINGSVAETNENNNCTSGWTNVTVGAAGPTLTTGTLIATPTTCTLTHGQGSCPVSFDWTTALQEDPVSQVVADINPSDNASGPDSTSLLLADTEILNVRRTGPTGQVFRLYNNTHDIAQATVTADCSVNTRLDTLSNLCVDPQVSSVTVSGQHYYSSPEQFTLTCFQSNAYKVLKNGSTFVATTTLPNLPSQVVTVSPTQPSSVNGDTYTFMCIYGNVGSNPQTTTSYDSSAPLIPDIFIDAYPKTINANGKSVISWSVTRPRLSAPFCAMTVSAVCTNNTCTQSQTQAAQQLQNTINTGKIDGSNTITIADAVKSVALGQVGINAKALGKKTLTASTTVDFKITCGAQSATTRVRVANSKEQ